MDKARMASELRKIAAELRDREKEAAKRIVAKSAHIIRAAKGMTLRLEKQAKADFTTEVKKEEAPPSAATKVAQLFKESAGEEISPEVAEKLASDDRVVDALNKLAESAARPNPLGEPSEKDAGYVAAPENKNERRKAAYDRFANFLTGNA
jgi:metal-dependent amidase/aminoacylase/carboxypeptidase family protein